MHQKISPFVQKSVFGGVKQKYVIQTPIKSYLPNFQVIDEIIRIAQTGEVSDSSLFPIQNIDQLKLNSCRLLFWTGYILVSYAIVFLLPCHLK